MGEPDLVRKLESALYAAGDRLGDRQVVRTRDWVRITTPSARTHFRSGVLRSVLAPEALECPATHSVCAGDGRAWIATTTGRFLHFDIEAASVTGRTVLTEARADPLKRAAYLGMRLALAPSGRLLAACSSFCEGGHVFDTELRVYRVDGGGLVEIASARATITHAVNDLTILEKEQAVIVATPLPVFVWHFESAGNG